MKLIVPAKNPISAFTSNAGTSRFQFRGALSASSAPFPSCQQQKSYRTRRDLPTLPEAPVRFMPADRRGLSGSRCRKKDGFGYVPAEKSKKVTGCQTWAVCPDVRSNLEIGANRAQETTQRRCRPSPCGLGTGSRASRTLMPATRARALLDGRYAPSVDDVIDLAGPVPRHRMALNFAARAEELELQSNTLMIFARTSYRAAWQRLSLHIRLPTWRPLAAELPPATRGGTVAATVGAGIHGRRRARAAAASGNTGDTEPGRKFTPD